jgi:hypothetical protein
MHSVVASQCSICGNSFSDRHFFAHTSTWLSIMHLSGTRLSLWEAHLLTCMKTTHLTYLQYSQDLILKPFNSYSRHKTCMNLIQTNASGSELHHARLLLAASWCIVPFNLYLISLSVTNHQSISISFICCRILSIKPCSMLPPTGSIKLLQPQLSPHSSLEWLLHE